MKSKVENQIVALLQTAHYEQAFKIIVAQFKEPLYFKIRDMLKTHHDTDDVLQNTFVKIWLNLPQFKFKSQVFSWCYRIAINEALQVIKNNKRLQTTEITSSVEVAEATYATVYSNASEIDQVLQRAITTLPEKQRMVFELRYFEGKKYTEMATQLQMTTGGLKANYHHAVQKIEHFIKNITWH